MGPPAWPGTEISPIEERALLPAARLRRFGVNYLQDAVCPGLGLLAHQDGSHVRLLTLSSRSNRGESWGGINGGVVADIDLEAGQRNHSSDSNGGKTITGKGGAGQGGLVATAECAARGLSWARCSSLSADGAVEATSRVRTGGSMNGAGSEEQQLRGGSSRDAQEVEQHLPVGVGDADKGNSGGGGDGSGGDGLHPSSSPSSASSERGEERVCHIAVACGPEVRLWKVSRVFCGDTAGAAGEASDGIDGYRYSIMKVLPDWHRTTRDDDNDSSGSKDTPSPIGNIRCLSFRPCSNGSSESPVAPARAAEDGAVPLTAWYDTGAAVLRPGGSRAVLPAPVQRKRACGAWSGCGRRLVVSNGGEIRVYSDPSEEYVPSATTTAVGGGDSGHGATIVVPGQLPARARAAWVGGSDSTVSSGTKESGIPPLEAQERGSWLSANRETTLADRSKVKDAESSTFRTVLCVEAAMYEGGILSSPGSSPGGTPASSPSSRPATAALRPRRGVGDIPAVPSTPRRNESELLFGGENGQHSSSTRTASSLSTPAAAAAAAVPMEVRSSSPVLVGDMRAMCPAGPLAFFGTTDGGLGLDSVLAVTGTNGLSKPFPAHSNGAGTKGRGDDLLGSIMNDGNRAHTAVTSEAGGTGVEKSTRRSGFRHVLPGENWLAGSLRPSSPKRVPDSPHRQRDASSESLVLPTESVSVVQAAGRNKMDVVETSVAESPVGASRPALLSSLPQSTAAPEVLDLRGKLGDRGTGGSGTISAASTHPLFRLSLSGEVDPVTCPTIGVNSITRDEGSKRLVSGIGANSSSSTSCSATADATPVRRSCLVRVSCKSRSSSSSSSSSSNTVVRGSGGSDGVGVKSLTPLPLELSSPDLLASSEDGRVVAVGSHACDLVVCFRLELYSSDVPTTTGNNNVEAKSSADPAAKSCTLGSTDGGPLGGGGGEPTVDRSGARRRRRRQRRAVPLCTLRLPPGYRAKGLTFVREQRSRDELCGRNAGTSVMPGSSSGAAEVTPADDSVADEVLVLAGCAVPDADVTTGAAAPRPSMSGASLPGEPHRRRGSSSSSSSEDTLYRTVLLRFKLPSGLFIGDGQDLVSPAPTSASRKPAGSDGAIRGGKGAGGGTVTAPSSLSDKSRNAGNSTSSSSGSKKVSGDPRHNRPPSTALTGGGDVADRGSHNASTAIGARGLPSNVAQGDDSFDGGVTRLEAVVLEAVAGVERRMNDRFNRVEGMLSGVCGRLSALEDAVNSQQAKN